MPATVSVIVPAYNAAEFLGECLASVEAQTFRDFEVVVVDDASSDATASIAGEWRRKDVRFRLVSLPENRGLSGARNAGIAAAEGEWLYFLDADDCLYPDTLEWMTGTLRRYGADVCRSAFLRARDYRPRLHPEVKVEMFDYAGAMKASLYQQTVFNPAWASLIRRERVVEAGGFTEGIWYEDLDSFYRFYEGAVRIAYIRTPLYFYRRNPGSFLAKWSDGRLDVLDVTDRLAAFFRERYPGLAAAAEDRRFSAHYNMLTLMKRHGVRNSDAMARCRAVIKEGRRRAFRDPEVRLKNKLGALLSYLFI